MWFNFWFNFGTEWLCLKRPNLAHFNVVANIYNEEHPYSALGCLSPMEFREKKSLIESRTKPNYSIRLILSFILNSSEEYLANCLETGRSFLSHRGYPAFWISIQVASLIVVLEVSSSIIVACFNDIEPSKHPYVSSLS